MKYLVTLLLFSFLLLLQAEKITIDDLEALKDWGASEEKIFQEVQQRGIDFNFDSSAYFRLRKSFSPAFLKKLKAYSKGDHRGIKITKKQTATQQKRLALVIGNGSYSDAPLRNPKNDADDIAATLRKLSFEVILVKDANRSKMYSSIRTFGDRLKKGGVGLFYYAGHGMQVKNSNYLIPVGSDIQREDEVEFQAIRADLVVNKMESAANEMNIIILDACRNNPFARSFRSSTRGLAQMEAPQGSIIVYATDPGDVAKDGIGQRNGVFTSSLLKYLSRPGLEVGKMIRLVGRDVAKNSNNSQIPWVHSSANRMDFFFAKSTQPVKTDSIIDPMEEKWLAWQENMKRNYSKVESIERRNVSMQYKLKYWKKFVSMYQGKNNPYSEEDEQLLQSALAKLKHWKHKTSRPKNTAKTISGFTYLRTKTYSCAGITNQVKEYRHNRTGMEFVLIPAGSFMMGSEDGHSDEKPVHRVTISKAFLMSKYEVTQGVWQKIMKTSPWSGKSYVKQGSGYPATYVSWDDADKFCKNIGLSLPTEAQWEYACRAGTQTKYYWGNNMDGNYAWWRKNARDIGEKYAHQVGQKKPNAFGLYDMSGNVWEWCLGYKREYSSTAVTDPADATHSAIRAYRGGSWYNDGSDLLRSAIRYDFRRDIRYFILGFRCVRSFE